MTQSNKHDFDFLLGTWRVLNRRLVAPLTGTDEWTVFPARLEGSRQLLDGAMMMEQYIAEFDGAPFEGVSIRMFSPETSKWSIYWMDTNRHDMVLQVVGEFKGEPKTFVGHGEEYYQGKPMNMRFVWKDITATSARWEQAYFDTANDTWETNWIMEITRDES